MFLFNRKVMDTTWTCWFLQCWSWFVLWWVFPGMLLPQSGLSHMSAPSSRSQNSGLQERDHSSWESGEQYFVLMSWNGMNVVVVIVIYSILNQLPEMISQWLSIKLNCGPLSYNHGQYLSLLWELHIGVVPQLELLCFLWLSGKPRY